MLNVWQNAAKGYDVFARKTAYAACRVQSTNVAKQAREEGSIPPWPAPPAFACEIEYRASDLIRPLCEKLMRERLAREEAVMRERCAELVRAGYHVSELHRIVQVPHSYTLFDRKDDEIIVQPVKEISPWRLKWRRMWRALRPLAGWKQERELGLI
jgi:hypothetical protein